MCLTVSHIPAPESIEWSAADLPVTCLLLFDALILLESRRLLFFDWDLAAQWTVFSPGLVCLCSRLSGCVGCNFFSVFKQLSLCSTLSFLPPHIHLDSSTWICSRLNCQNKYLGDLTTDPPWWHVVAHRHQRAPGCLPAGAQSCKQSSSVGMLGEENSFTLAEASSCFHC